MYRKLILIPILFFSGFVVGQKRWAASLSGSLNLTSITIPSNDYSSILPSFGYSGSLNIHNYPNESIFFRSGINFYSTAFNNQMPLYPNYQSSSGVTSSLNNSGNYPVLSIINSSKYLELPILIGWKSKSNNKVHFYGTIGPSISLYLFTNSFYEIIGGTNFAKNESTYQATNISVGLNGILTAGISVDLSPKISLLIENQFRMNVISQIGGNYNNAFYGATEHPFGDGIQLSLLYFLK